jgi:hypothetical protein
MHQRRRDRRTSLETCTSTLPLILFPKSKFTALKSTKSNDYSQSGNCWKPCFSTSKFLNSSTSKIFVPQKMALIDQKTQSVVD